MDIRLIVSDIDRTIVPVGGGISPATVEAVRDCRARGTEFAICSGRWFPSAWDVSARQLSIKDGYMIICNGGAVVKSDGTILMEDGLNRAQAEVIYEMLRKEPVTLTAYARGAIYRLGMEHLTVYRLPEVSSRIGGVDYEIVDEDEPAFVKYGLERPYKLEAHSDDRALLARLTEELEKTGLEIGSSYPNNVEIMAPGTGKGAATLWLAGYLGLERNQVMGFGDFLNDLPMLNSVGWPMAVGNALDEVKAACRAVVPACEDDGVAWAIREYVLGGGEL